MPALEPSTALVLVAWRWLGAPLAADRGRAHLDAAVAAAAIIHKGGAVPELRALADAILTSPLARGTVETALDRALGALAASARIETRAAEKFSGLRPSGRADAAAVDSWRERADLR